MKLGFTLITPVYNGQDNLERCIDSVILASQSLNIELLIIDDGSTDDSAEIIRRYCNEYSWIKYVYQENSGPSSARNTGLNLAKGDYIGFLDCDDCISESYFLELIEATKNNPDIVVFGYERILKSGNSKYFSPEIKKHNNSQEELLSNLTGDRELFWFSCTKIFKRIILEDIRFDEKMRLGEDTIFNMMAVKNAKSIVRINSVLYSYYETPGSLSSNSYKPNLLENMERHFQLRLSVHKSMNSHISKEVWNDIYLYYIFHILPWLFSNLLWNSKPCQLKELKEIRKSNFVNLCYSKGCYLGKGPRIIMIQILFRMRLLRLLRAFLSLISAKRAS